MSDAESLFRNLDKQLQDNIAEDYYCEPRDFRSLIKVLEVLNDTVGEITRRGDDLNELHTLMIADDINLNKKLDMTVQVIEEVVKFQHGGLNNSLDTMTDVVKEYTRGRDEIQLLRKSLSETQSVLTANKSGQVSLRDLWLKKIELQEQLRLVKEIENLKNTPLKIERFVQQKKFYSAVLCLNKSIIQMFSEDLVEVSGLTPIREQIMDLKEVLLESCVQELKTCILGSQLDLDLRDDNSLLENDIASDSKSEIFFDHGAHLIKNDISDKQTSVNFGIVDTEQFNSFDSQLLSYNLSEIDENFESNIIDPSNSNSIYIRLLVKAVTVLNFEEDALRMILESISVSFYEMNFMKFKSLVKEKLQSVLTKQSLPLSSEGEAFIIKGFSGYISTFLSNILDIIHRLLYITKLIGLANNKSIDSKQYFRIIIETIWTQLESYIIEELKIHLVDLEVEKISDNFNHEKSSSFNPEIVSNEENFDELIQSEKSIFPPSAKFAAFVYKKIIDYSISSKSLLQNFNLDSTKKPNQETNKSFEPLSLNSLLIYIQKYLEEEFIPIIQSSINKETREMQTNLIYFSSKNESKTPCIAAQKVSDEVKSLFDYWQQLFQHRTMVSVVIDRLIRGYIASAKDNFESILFSWCPNSSFSKFVIHELKNDRIYTKHNMFVLNDNETIENLLNITTRKNSNLEVFEINSKSYLNELNHLMKFTSLDTTDFNIVQKILANLEMTQMLLNIQFGSDWLIKSLSSKYLISMKQYNSDLLKSAQLNGKSALLFRPDFQDNKNYLLEILSGTFRELQKLSDEVLGMLRSSIEIYCISSITKSVHISTSEIKNSDPILVIDELNLSSIFFQNLGILHQIFSKYLYPTSLPIIFGPLCVFIPKLLKFSFLSNLKILSKLPTFNYQNLPETKSLCLRILVSLQQQLTLFFQKCLSFDGEIRKFILEISAEEFERVRKFISIIDSSKSEIQAYKNQFPNEIQNDEIQLIELLSSNR